MIRRADPGEGAALTELALRSKAVRGYSASFIERCRAALTVTAAYIDRNVVLVAEADGAIAGFCALRTSGEGMELDMLFVEPAMLRRGIGAGLLDRACAEAHAAGHDRVVIASDPDAEAFYLRRGAVRIGDVRSEVEPGRFLPMLSLATAEASAPRSDPKNFAHDRA